MSSSLLEEIEGEPLTLAAALAGASAAGAGGSEIDGGATGVALVLGGAIAIGRCSILSSTPERRPIEATNKRVVFHSVKEGRVEEYTLVLVPKGGRIGLSLRKVALEVLNKFLVVHYAEIPRENAYSAFSFGAAERFTTHSDERGE